MRNGSVPVMHSTSESTVIRHREYIQDIVSSSTANNFHLNTFPINPGLSSTFPWLSTIASQYQEYSFKGLLFEFKSTSADAIASSTNTALGSVMMATHYNPVLPDFTSKTQMLNEHFANDGKPSDNIIHFIECDPKENPFNILYVRNGAVPSNGNIQNYDLGELGVATTGIQGASNVCGELWVSYEVELKKPQASELSGISNSVVYYQGSSPTTSAYFGTQLIKAGSWFDGTVTFGTTTITIDSTYTGPFALVLSYNAATSSLPTVTSTTNVGAFSPFVSGTASTLLAGNGTASATGVYAFAYTQTTGSANRVVLTLSGGTLTTPVNAFVLLLPLSPDIDTVP